MYSGGGIEPDRRVAGPVEGFNPTRFGRALWNSTTAACSATFAQRFDVEGDTRVKQTPTGRKTAKPNFVVDDAMVTDFKSS